MGRLEALIVAALGRSPYDEEVIENTRSGDQGRGVLGNGQQYDERGHPVNSETRQRIRDHIRASNEVLHAAGIIEETEEVKARDRKVQAVFHDEQTMGRRRLFIGPMVLVSGIWGVCGMRRRILLYRSYSEQGVLVILQQERARYSIPHMVFAGFPAFVIYQVIEWVKAIINELIRETSLDDPSQNDSGQKQESKISFAMRHLLNAVPIYFMLHYRTFAMLQQLNLIPSERWAPSLKFFVPFSDISPLQLPRYPSLPNGPTSLSRVIDFGVAVAPMALMLLHTKVYHYVAGSFYKRIHAWLPRPVNPDIKQLLADFYADSITGSRMLSPSETMNAPDSGLDNDAELTEGWDAMTIPTVDNAPTQHTATLQALEGRSIPDITAVPIDDSSDEEDPILTDGAYISLDMDPRVPEGSHGTWSAELQRVGPRIKTPIYHITALTMLPVNLAAEGFSAVLTGIVLSPFEAQMIRAVGRAFRRGSGGGTADMFRFGLDPAVISWQGSLNLITVQVAELAMTGLIWTLFTVGSQFLGGTDDRWRVVEEETNERRA